MKLTSHLCVLEVDLLQLVKLGVDVLYAVLDRREEPADVCVVEEHSLVLAPSVDMEVLLQHQVEHLHDRLQQTAGLRLLDLPHDRYDLQGVLQNVLEYRHESLEPVFETLEAIAVAQ